MYVNIMSVIAKQRHKPGRCYSNQSELFRRKFDMIFRCVLGCWVQGVGPSVEHLQTACAVVTQQAASMTGS